MAKIFNFKCPECEQDIELEARPDGASMICPSCAKDIPLPAKGKSGAVIALALSGVVILLATIFVFVFIHVQAQKAKERQIVAKRAMEAAARLKEVKRIQVEEAEKQRWLELTKLFDRSKVKTDDDYYRAFSALEKYQGGDPDDIAALRMKLEKFKAADIQAAMVKLDIKAKTFDDKKEFIKAAAVYQDYNSDFKGDTEDSRKKSADIYFAKADDAVAAKELAEEKVEQAKEASLNELAAGVISGKISDAILKFNASPYKKDYPEVSKMVEDLTRVNKIILDSFKGDIGKNITVFLKGGKKKTKLLIKKIEKNRIYVEYKKAKLTMIKKYSVKDLDEVEIITRLKAFNEKTAALMVGLKSIKKRNYDVAEEYFQNTGNFAIPLMAELAKYREKLQAAASMKTKPKKGKKQKKKALGALDVKKIKISVKVTKGGKERMERGNLNEKLNARISVTNTTGQRVDGYTVVVYLIGQSLRTKKIFKIISELQENITLEERKVMQKKHTVFNMYNNGAEIDAGFNRVMIIPRSGYKYYSYLMILKDPDGKIKISKSKHSKFEKSYETIVKCGDSAFDGDGNKLKTTGFQF